MKNVNICIFESDPLLKPYVRDLKKEATEAVKRISKLILLKNVDILIAHRPENVAYGAVSGKAFSKNRVLIGLDVLSKNFKKNWRIELQQTLAHELYHTVRPWINFPQLTLSDSCFDEGLALHFEEEVFGLKEKKDWVPLKGSKLQQVLKLAQEEFSSKKYSHDDWFHGTNTKKIPEAAGYNVGYFLVEKILKNNPQAKASNLVAKKASVLIVKSGLKI